jgi:tripartite-type tricarboxylate transporter receptor subunit TctC
VPPRSIRVCLLAIACGGLPDAAVAQGYPSRPIRLVVPFAPGGTNDIVGRLVGLRLAERWGQPVVIDNRAGASGVIGSDLVAKAQPDGYTLLTANVNFAVNPALFAKMPYDTVRDFAPVGLVAQSPSLLVTHPGAGIASVADLIAQARAKPRQVNYGTSGAGATGHLAMELFNLMAKVEMTAIHYKGGGPQLIDILSGRVPVGFTTILPSVPHVQGGRLRALAVSGPRRTGALPQVPTVAESGLPGYEFTGWWGLAAPAGTPAAIVARLNDALRALVADPDVRRALDRQGADAVGMSPAEFGTFIRTEATKWSKVAIAAGLKAE